MPSLNIIFIDTVGFTHTHQNTPILSDLDVPPNQITTNTTKITPDMLPLIDLTQGDIDIIASQVEGGIANIQDIYSLAPVQDGILLEHVLSPNSDPYLTSIRMYFDNRDILDHYLNAYCSVAKRHDIMRSVVIWEGVTTPAQVVLRSITIPIIELSLSPENGPITEQMTSLNEPRYYRINLSRSPSYQYVIAQDIDDGRWIVDELIHHLMSDQITLEKIRIETKAFMAGKGNTLPPPQPYRNLIAQVRSGISIKEHENFFSNMLAGIESPAIPYGASSLLRSTSNVVEEAYLMLSPSIDKRLREQSKRIGVSTARICHVAWAQVISRISGQEHVVFGTVVSGRSRSSVASEVLGPFMNTLPIRINATDVGLLDSLNRAQSDISSILKHEHATLSLAQRCRNVPDRNPLFYSILNFRKSADQSVVNFDSGIVIHRRQEMTTYPFAMTVEYGGPTLGFIAQVSKPNDASRICRYMKQVLESIVNALEFQPNIPVRELEVIPVEERETLVRVWNDTTADIPNDVYIHQQFEYHAKHSPNSLALFFEGQKMSYHQLNDHANRLAHHLIKLGVKPNSLVAICVSRSFAMIIGLLAVLKAGGAYVPLDPSFASERLQNILSDASITIILADNSGTKALQSPLLQSIKVVDPNIIYEGPACDPKNRNMSPHDLAYIIYTSGSTGKPKGVMIEHQSVSNLALTRPSVFGVNSSSSVLQFFSISFDGSIHEFVSALCHGGALHILTDATRIDRSKLWDYLGTHSITHATLTPALIQDCTDMPRLDTPLTIILAGEALSPVLLKDLRTLIPNGTIINDYGPTEATVDAIGWRCPQNFHGETVPIGRPHANKRVYILDEHRNLVPIGAIGELYIAGVGIARGYINRPELTEKLFSADPFYHGSNGQRMYRTGDLVRYLPDGNLEYLGRNDHQVKIRGYRIELGEIESQLSDHPSVKESVVIARGEGDKKRLIAYIVATSKERLDILPSMLRTHLSAKLPDYMVPSAFVCLDTFPLTPNSKIDNQALPEPERSDFSSQGYDAPQGDIETKLANLWEAMLKVKRVGRNDDFFMLGGHSLLAVRMIKEIKTTLGKDVKLQTLFETPTIAELAPYILLKETKKDPMFDVLLPLKTQGNRLPLFCIHAAAGLAWSYQRLIKHFHPDQPIYGLQARGMDGIENRAASIEEMTDDYIDQIRSVQLRGPYHILGWSFGGNLAQNIATQLRRRGEQVAMLAVMDSTLDYDIIASDIETDIERVFFDSFNTTSGSKDSEEEGKILWGKVQLAIKNNLKLARKFSTVIYPGDMIYFSATKTVPFIEPTSWAPFTLGKIEVHNVECKHIEMDQPEYISVVGHVLAKRLNDSHKFCRPSKL
ncbi:hypothetical protein BGZ76_009547 [Entomortierella beljakovae]|nr:hypothetical protein BGZ76_009547 [Entomortierella beljakovae]